MILSKRPLTLAEVREYVSDSEENKIMNDYLKAYCKIEKDKAILLSKELVGLNNIKMKEEYIVKIVDLLPQDSEDLNKIFVDVMLTEEESNAVLAIVKKY